MKKDTNVDNQQVKIKKELIYSEDSCPVRATMQVVGGKWKIILINIINRESPARFGELKRKADGITQTMLTAMLRELEDDGIIKRRIYAEIPPRVEYTLTKLGLTLLPIINNMADWGRKHVPPKHMKVLKP